MTLDDFANKDILDVDDVRYMKNIWPEEYPAVAAAKLAERVERAPQYCRFLTFERLNLLRLYKLQHDILTYLPESEEDVAPGTQLLTRPEPSLLMTPAPQQRRFAGTAASSSQPMVKDGYSDIGIIEGHLDEKLMALIQEYNEALRAFKEMQSWSRATSESCSIARSDFAFHFREEKYILSRDSMYDLSPRGGPGDTDRVRRWLIEKLPLRYVNPAAWDLRRTRQDRDPPGGSPRESRWLWLRNLFRDEDGEDVDEGGGDNVVDAQKREKISRTGTSVSVRETKDITPFVDNAARIIVSVTAGLFLLVPMIVLSFITSQKARLGTTVAFVIVFAVVLGRFSKATNDALMGATAAYAAVLVVFVGQTTPIS